MNSICHKENLIHRSRQNTWTKNCHRFFYRSSSVWQLLAVSWVEQSRIWPVLLRVLNFKLPKLKVGYSRTLVKSHTSKKDRVRRIMLLDFLTIHWKMHNTKADLSFRKQDFHFCVLQNSPQKVTKTLWWLKINVNHCCVELFSSPSLSYL